jgi:hypothetical protein
MEEQITKRDIHSVKIALAAFAVLFFGVGLLIGIGLGVCL